MNKYRNIKTTIDGFTFDSKKEAERYTHLLFMQRAGLIAQLRLQVPFVLMPKSNHGGAIKYIADFTYFDCKNKQQVIEDVKGIRTDIYKLKKRMMAELGYEILEV